MMKNNSKFFGIIHEKYSRNGSWNIHEDSVKLKVDKLYLDKYISTIFWHKAHLIEKSIEEESK